MLCDHVVTPRPEREHPNGHYSYANCATPEWNPSNDVADVYTWSRPAAVGHAHEGPATGSGPVQLKAALQLAAAPLLARRPESSPLSAMHFRATVFLDKRFRTWGHSDSIQSGVYSKGDSTVANAWCVLDLATWKLQRDAVRLPRGPIRGMEFRPSRKSQQRPRLEPEAFQSAPWKTSCHGATSKAPRAACVPALRWLARCSIHAR